MVAVAPEGVPEATENLLDLGWGFVRPANVDRLPEFDLALAETSLRRGYENAGARKLQEHSRGGPVKMGARRSVRNARPRMHEVASMMAGMGSQVDEIFFMSQRCNLELRDEPRGLRKQTRLRE